MTLLQAIKDEMAATFGPRRPVVLSGASKRRPTKVERMLLIAAAAQLMAGPGKNPTRAQIAAATRGVDHKISNTTSSGSWSSGSFWSKVSSLAKQAGGAAVRAAPAAAKWAGQNPQILLPLAAGAVASPFLISAITAASKSKQALSEASTSPPPAPEGETVAAVAPSDSAPAAAPEEGEPGALSMGLWHGWDEVSSMHGELSEEEIILGECGGAAEREALMRTHSVLGGQISHDAYRASVIHNARRLAGGSPQTKHIFLAEKMVKGKLRRDGLSVQIPGAAPGRRTI